MVRRSFTNQPSGSSGDSSLNCAKKDMLDYGVPLYNGGGWAGGVLGCHGSPSMTWGEIELLRSSAPFGRGHHLEFPWKPATMNWRLLAVAHNVNS